MTLEEAEDLAKHTDYACEATHQDENPINWADAAAFFLVGYEYAMKEIGKLATAHRFDCPNIGAVVRCTPVAEGRMEKVDAAFEKELTHLINRHSIENYVDMPDFFLSRMLCAMIESMGPTVKATLDWHGCDSVCHPRQDNATSDPAVAGRRG